MKLFERIHAILGFTRSERRVILLLSVSLLVGWGIRWYRDSHSSAPAFDYAAADSEFAARSSAVIDEERDSAESAPDTRAPRHVGHAPAGIININTASKAELVVLPGIGEAMAERIILYREDHGPFRSVTELANVKGIGKKKLERLLPLCTTGK